jgi:hypothetical protein
MRLASKLGPLLTLSANGFEPLFARHKTSEVTALKDKIGKSEKLVGKLTVENDLLKRNRRPSYPSSALHQSGERCLLTESMRFSKDIASDSVSSRIV